MLVTAMVLLLAGPQQEASAHHPKIKTYSKAKFTSACKRHGKCKGLRVGNSRHRKIAWIRHRPNVRREMRVHKLPAKTQFFYTLRTKHGWSKGERQAAAAFLNREGPYNPCAYYGNGSASCVRDLNGANIACGIAMFLPCRGYGQPMVQATMFHSYIRGRYGNGWNALAFWNRNHWY